MSPEELKILKRESTARLYAYRRLHKLCIRCGVKSPNFTCCFKCRRKDSEYHKKNYGEKRKQKRIEAKLKKLEEKLKAKGQGAS